MSMISKLKSVPLTIAPEPKAEDVIAHPERFGVDIPKFPVPKFNIPEATDSFESADPLKTGIFTYIHKPSGQDQMVQPEPAINPSDFFNYVAGLQEAQPPAPPDTTFDAISTNNFEPVNQAIADAGQFLEDVSDHALDAGLDAYNGVVKAFSDAGDVAEDVVDELAKPVGDLMYGDTVDDVVDFVSTEIVDRGLNGMRDIGMEKEADWIQNTAGDVIRFAGDTVDEAGDVAEDVIDFIGDAGSDVGDFAEDVIDTVAAPAYDVVTGDAIDDVIAAGEDALDAIGDAASDAADAAGDVIDDIGDAAEDGLDAVGDAAEDVGDWLGDLW